ncbi:MAG: cloacin immunity family protein [Gammaproteobacteria bacterium]|nr:cloacin immunity family protein [Gammaproteobacteria bacterium]
MPDRADVAINLNWYDNEGNILTGEEPISNMTVDEVLHLFDAPFWNKLYHCWKASRKELKVIQPNIQHQIDTKKFSYFVEIYKIQNSQQT